jgi:copper chaperone CopZ
MKLIVAFSLAAVLMGCSGSDSSNLSSNFNQSNSFHVYGNCGMCEKTIENAFSDVDGVGEVDWNKETKQIKVDFDSTKISLFQIKNKIAGVGYDTKEVRAEESVYSSLPGCCQYERPE